VASRSCFKATLCIMRLHWRIQLHIYVDSCFASHQPSVILLDLRQEAGGCSIPSRVTPGDAGFPQEPLATCRLVRIELCVYSHLPVHTWLYNPRDYHEVSME
jgi:hypothetical protein